MFHPSGFPAFLALGLLANRVLAAPTLAARSDASVSSSLRAVTFAVLLSAL